MMPLIQRASRLVWNVLPWVGVLVLTWASHQPSEVIARSPILGPDKLTHFGAFSLLAALGLPPYRSPRSRGRWFVFLAAFAIADELHQAFIPGRSPEALDVAADWCGIGFIWASLRLRRKAASGKAG